MADTKGIPTPPENAPEPKKAEDFEEMGIATSLPISDWGSFAYGIKHAGDGSLLLPASANAVPLEKLRDMRRRDGQTRALLRLFILPILSCLDEAEWIEPEEGGAEAETEFANQMFRLAPQSGGMTSPLSKVMKQTLLGLLEGYSVFEEVRQVPKKGPLKGKIVLRKLAHRDATTIKFKVDDHGGYNGVVQTAHTPDGKIKEIDIPKEKTWYWAANEEENPFYGVSYFESAWYHYEIKTKLYYIAHLAAQHGAVSGRVGEYPQNAGPNEKAAFRKALRDFAFNTSMAHPAGYKVNAFNSNSGFDFLKLIEHHSHMQSKSVLMKFLDDENRMVLIDNGRSDASADMYVQALEAIMSEIAESWTTHLMPKYIEWNFGTEKYPVFRFGQLSDSARDDIKEIFSVVVNSSILNSTPEFVRELEKKLAQRLGLDIDYDEIEKHEEEAAKAQAEMSQLEAEAQASGLMPEGGEGAPAPGGGAPPTSGAMAPGAPAQAATTADATAAMSVSEEEQEAIDNLVAMAQSLLSAHPQSGVVAVEDALQYQEDG